MSLFSKTASTLQGDNAERLALEFLQSQGLQWVCANFRCKVGELDLVMRDGEALVIVEVRFRQSEQFGGALASITRQKQARIVAATQHYVIINRLSHCAIRFDVVAVSGDGRITGLKRISNLNTL